MKAPMSSSAIEILESRIAPAVILGVTVGKAGVTIAEEAGSTGDNPLVLNIDAMGALHVAPTGATQLRFGGQLLAAGTEAVVSGFTGNISAKLGVGTDQITVTGKLPGALSADLGPGANLLDLSSATVGGKLTVKGGAGVDTVTFSGTTTRVFGSVNLALGDGVNTLNNTTSSLLYVGGDFIATSGKGNDDLLMAGSNVQILGKLGLNSGAGSDSAGFLVTGGLSVGRDVSLIGTGLAGQRTDLTLNAASIFVGGAVTMDVKAGFTNQKLVSPGTIFVGGAAKFTSSGTDSFTDVAVGASSGSATVLHIGGALVATTKSPSADFAINDVAFGTLVGGLTATGFNSVAAELSGAIIGPVNVALATGTDGYFFAGTILNAADPLALNAVTVTSKTVGATLSLLNVIAQGAVKMTGTLGDDIFAMDDVLLLGAMKVDLGAGSDSFHIEDGNIPTGTSQINAALTLLGGAGADSFSFSGNIANRTLNAVASILVDGGADLDSVTLGVNGDYQGKLTQKNI